MFFNNVTKTITRVVKIWKVPPELRQKLNRILEMKYSQPQDIFSISVKTFQSSDENLLLYKSQNIFNLLFSFFSTQNSIFVVFF